MIMRKSMLVLASSLFLLTYQAVAQERTQPGVHDVHEDKATQAETYYGVVNSIDPARSQLVISDTVYDYSPWKLIVRRGERIAGMSSLRPNQEVRYICLPRKPGSSLSAARTITEIWIEKN